MPCVVFKTKCSKNINVREYQRGIEVHLAFSRQLISDIKGKKYVVEAKTVNFTTGYSSDVVPKEKK